MRRRRSTSWTGAPLAVSSASMTARGRRTRRPSGGSGKPWCGPARWRNSSPGSTRILRTPDISPGYPAMGGQIVDATIVAAPRQRMTDAGKEIVKGIEVWKRGASRLIGRPIPGNRRKRIATRVGRSSEGAGRRARTGTAMGAIATPVFGCKSHINADRRHGFVRTWIVTDAARHDGRVAGGHDVSVAEQREENRPGRADPEGPFLPPARQADARASREGQCRRVEGPIRDRTSLRRDEGTNGALRPHHRLRPGEG